MSTRIMTLFGDEIVPEPAKPAAKARAKKKDTPQQEATEEEAPAAKQEEIVAPAEPIAQKEEAIQQQEVTEEVPVAQEQPVRAPIPAEEPIAKKEKPEKVTIPKEVKPNLPEDWEGDKTYYGIGEVAEFFKVKTSHIRFWTNEFKLKVRTTRKGDRLYTPEQVKELRAIYHLVKERGFTLSGAKTKLKTQNKRDVETVDLKTSLTLLKNKLVILRDQLS